MQSIFKFLSFLVGCCGTVIGSMLFFPFLLLWLISRIFLGFSTFFLFTSLVMSCRALGATDHDIRDVLQSYTRIMEDI